MKKTTFNDRRLHVKQDRDVEMAGLHAEYPLTITPAMTNTLLYAVLDFFPIDANLNDDIALHTTDSAWLTGALYNLLQARGQTLPLPVVTKYVHDSNFFQMHRQMYQVRLAYNLLAAGQEFAVVCETLTAVGIAPDVVTEANVKLSRQKAQSRAAQNTDHSFVDNIYENICDLRCRLSHTTDPQQSQHLQQLIDSKYELIDRLSQSHCDHDRERE